MARESGSLTPTLRLIWPHAKPYLPSLLLVVALGSLSAFAQRAILLLLTPTWEVLFGDGGGMAQMAAQADGGGWLQDTARNWFFGGSEIPADGDARFAALRRVVLAASLLATLAGLTQYFFVRLSRWVALRTVVGLRMTLAQHLMGLSLRYHNQRRLGDLLSRISSDVSTTLTVINVALRDLVQQPLLALFSLGWCFLIAPMPTLFVVVCIPLLAIPISLLSRKIRRRSTKSLTALGSSVQALSQMFQGVRTVKAFAGEEREVERFGKLNEGYVRDTMRMVRALAFSNAWTILYSHLGLAALMLVVGWYEIRHGGFGGGGNMLTFFMLISGVYSAIKATTRAVTRAQESVGASERLTELIDEPVEIEDRPGAKEITGLGSGVAFENVTLRYPGASEDAISDLSFHLRPGETLALVGPSGAGKTTVVDLVARFIEPTAGRVTVDGVDLNDWTLASWNRQYALVGQEPFLFHTTVQENIQYGRMSATQAEVEEAAEAADIQTFIESLPEGYETNVEDAGARLSGGQRQRITIARAFLKAAPLLLLDEPTSALDSTSEAAVQQALERLLEGHTAIVIAHRLSTIRKANRIAVLEEGKLVELGQHDELLAKGGLYSRLYHTQMTGMEQGALEQ